MMAMTTNNSNNVKPERKRELTSLDIRKGYPDLKSRSRTGKTEHSECFTFSEPDQDEKMLRQS